MKTRIEVVKALSDGTLVVFNIIAANLNQRLLRMLYLSDRNKKESKITQNIVCRFETK